MPGFSARKMPERLEPDYLAVISLYDPVFSLPCASACCGSIMFKGDTIPIAMVDKVDPAFDPRCAVSGRGQPEERKDTGRQVSKAAFQIDVICADSGTFGRQQ